MKTELLDEVVLTDGTKGTVVEFDTGSPLGYDICIRSSIGSGETVKRWIRVADIKARKFSIDDQEYKWGDERHREELTPDEPTEESGEDDETNA